MGGPGSGRRNPPRLTLPLSEVKPRCPTWLDKAGKKEWRKLADILDRVPDLMKEVDWYLVAILADSWSTYLRMRDIENGTTATTLKPHHVVRLKIESKNTIMQCLTQLGMTPQARRQLHGQQEPAQPENPLGEYLHRIAQ